MSTGIPRQAAAFACGSGNRSLLINQVAGGKQVARNEHRDPPGRLLPLTRVRRLAAASRSTAIPPPALERSVPAGAHRPDLRCSDRCSTTATFESRGRLCCACCSAKASCAPFTAGSTLLEAAADGGQVVAESRPVLLLLSRKQLQDGQAGGATPTSCLGRLGWRRPHLRPCRWLVCVRAYHLALAHQV